MTTFDTGWRCLELLRTGAAWGHISQSNLANEIPEEDFVDAHFDFPDESNWMDFQVHAEDELLPIYDDEVRHRDCYERTHRGCSQRFAIGEGSIPAPAEGDHNCARRTHKWHQSLSELKRKRGGGIRKVPDWAKPINYTDTDEVRKDTK